MIGHPTTQDRCKVNQARKYGINIHQIETFSKGESEPIAEKITKKGRSENRRIELKIN